MRQMEFKMERTGLLQVDEVLPVTEYALSNSYYYVLGRSYAMSGNYTTLERLKTQDGKTEGKVVDIKETPKGFYVTVEFEDS
ncbi:hypothetical protein SAMN02910298_00867 [Pseudobutyrivibrio sp. YE44]|uniref:hypothetical protein n=1 Tax=Pseudobutyrivibrio sp. YE44 TaxID=1520802 RepID=UPI000891753B|nr:hypothetical protein [Pseudobutyrivibrio sp. YE44]SDB19124.1 hypothetical protein SAMN02910298_00867 [Pseudobutyrivibrio sp. YE44]